jgi:hypothetical protein
MTGSALKRARKQGFRLSDGTTISFSYMPRVVDLPSGFRHFSTADKITHLLGMPLDRALEIVVWDWTQLDPAPGSTTHRPATRLEADEP